MMGRDNAHNTNHYTHTIAAHACHRDSPPQYCGGAVGIHSTGRGEAHPTGCSAEPEHLETKVWGALR